MVDPTLPLPGLSPVSGKAVTVRFDGGRLSSDGGLLLLREVERRLGLADRLAACIEDPRDPDQIIYSLAEIIRFRLLMIAAGYEDGNDATTLRLDPMFKRYYLIACGYGDSALNHSANTSSVTSVLSPVSMRIYPWHPQIENKKSVALLASTWLNTPAPAT